MNSSTKRPVTVTTCRVRPAVDVEHFARYGRGLGQIHDRIRDVVDGRNPAHRRQLFRKSLGSLLCSGVSTTPGATAFTRMPSFAYSIARLE